MQPFHVGLAQPETQAEIYRNAGHQETMLVGPLMVAPYRCEPVRQAVLGDGVSNFSTRVPRSFDIDLRTAQHRPEHRCDAGSSLSGSRPPTELVFTGLNWRQS